MIHPSTARRLLDLNRDFYDRFALPFAESRSVLSPGIRRALARMGGRRSLLDLGCGDGRVGRALAAGTVESDVTRYVGLDFSPELLARSGFAGGEAATAAAAPTRHTHNPHDQITQPRLLFLEADLVSREWPRRPELAPLPFDAALCLALLHHLPGDACRSTFLRQVRGLLAADGVLVLSVWQFLHITRMRGRVIPWREAGISEDAVDPGDLLLDWRRGGRGLRYVHHFTPDELITLCRQSGYTVEESYRSDGRTGDLGLYLVLIPSP